MKFLIASDIHGSARFCRELLERFSQEKADRLLLLGDLLYHGPRNDLPEEYAPKKVAEMLNGLRDRIMCVRGNCEAEVDQMMLGFPVMADYALMPVGARLVYMTHGHHAGEDAPPPLSKGDILLCGHTHIPKCAEHEGFVYMNPGSVSIPKEGSERSYMIYDGGEFLWKRLSDGAVYKQYRI
ncbi:MAG: phosphodiesterase [Eubacteriales bacterium]|nr:phosphodiesterase [Eubacteriales bacterium]MDD3881431.1 phosphodiesterase [Eubacteriales bacterium]